MPPPLFLNVHLLCLLEGGWPESVLTPEAMAVLLEGNDFLQVQPAGETGPCALSSWAQENAGLGRCQYFQVNAQGWVVLSRRAIDFSCSKNSNVFVQCLSIAEFCLIILLFWFWFSCLF